MKATNTPRARCLAERRTLPRHTEMPICSPHESASGGNDNSSGVPLPRSLLNSRVVPCVFQPFITLKKHSNRNHSHTHPGVATHGRAKRSRTLSTAERCPCLPVCHSCQGRRVKGGINPTSTHTQDSLCWWTSPVALPVQLWSVLVNLPLDSRSVDPHSTTVWCGNLLHSSPQPHTARWALERITQHTHESQSFFCFWIASHHTSSVSLGTQTSRENVGVWPSQTRFFFWDALVSPNGVIATTTKICSGRRSNQGRPQSAQPCLPCPFYMLMLCFGHPQRTVDCEGESSLSLFHSTSHRVFCLFHAQHTQRLSS